MRRLLHLSSEQKDHILSGLSLALRNREEVLFAYVYGSFLEDCPCHDLDVAIFLRETRQPTSPMEAEKLALDLERELGGFLGAESGGLLFPIPPVEVKVLNQAPHHFCYHVLKGRLLLSCDETTRIAWAIRTISSYLDMKPLRHRALKEAMSSWD